MAVRGKPPSAQVATLRAVEALEQELGRAPLGPEVVVRLASEHSAAAARNYLSRLTARGWLSKEGAGVAWFYSVTEEGRAAMEEG
jgi:hypothetical protein